MSDLQDLIHKTTMDSIERGRIIEQERIIKLLTDKYSQLINASRWADSNYYLDAIALIKGKTNG